MDLKYSIRYAANPEDVNNYNTQRLRDDFLIDNVFSNDEINLVYSLYDRFIVGGAQPVKSPVKLETIEPLKSAHFLDRRELGIINVGEEGRVTVDDEEFTLKNKEALYVTRGAKDVVFYQSETNQPLFYLNSAPAHTSYTTKKIAREDANVIDAGFTENSNKRTIRQMIVQKNVSTCQLQMGITELKEGSVWNTMPCHVHNRRMETYFYFDMQDDEVASHFMGEPENTRHIWLQNNQAVLSPPWSIHCGSGTSNYTFIWGMAGENLDYDDMDKIAPSDLR